MRFYQCACENTLFFDNSQCLSCGREVGYCSQCREIAALEPIEAGKYRCTKPDCGAELVKCKNYSLHNVCNRCVAVDNNHDEGLCDCCRFNDTIPDLTVQGNLAKWYRLEAAKRRLFYDLGQLGLPFGTAADGIDPPLSFDFKADFLSPEDLWRGGDEGEKVFTGHDQGRITINVREADSAWREKQRVDMRESHRSLIGHFRHEIGHYYWDLLVKGRREDESRAVFGDHDNPTYPDALAQHYQNGPPVDWKERFISSYATMHPWEDFAETWAAYLDMCSMLDTAQSVGFGGESDPVNADLDFMIRRHQQLGIACNEMNRNMGLLDAVPQIFVRPVVEKMRFVHSLVLDARAQNGALGGQTSAATAPQPVGAA